VTYYVKIARWGRPFSGRARIRAMFSSAIVHSSYVIYFAALRRAEVTNLVYRC
jgi:hypothetical protein